MRCKRIGMLGIAALLLLTSAPIAAKDRAADNAGYIHGTVEMESGKSYTGFLRWGTEEAFWDDLFNSSKDDLPYADRGTPRKDERRRVKVFGMTFGYRWDGSSSGRVFIARFGDIATIEPTSGDRARVTMKSGTVYDVDGSSNDVESSIAVDDDSLGQVELSWKRIERITFTKAPASLRPTTFRLRGRLEAEDATFQGYIQWDSQECLSTDKLDGDAEDGEMSIEMGRIRSIEKRGRGSARVELKDGRHFDLDGSNDVNDSIRGIFVEDERIGRVKISWDAFEKVVFQDGGSSGRGYDTYKAAKALHGKVETRSGTTHRGKLVFDLDETESWEMLNGSRDDVEYYIPFDKIVSILPRRGDESRVKLRGGLELDLEDGQDVSERNAGVLVIRDDQEDFVAWDEIEQIDFD